MVSNFNYFAIGSMINPISINLRGIKPLASVPAELLNHRIGFFTAMGIAETIPDEGSSLHGVMHTLSPDDMKLLDEIEQGLHARILAVARLYDGSEVQVTLYGRNSDHRDCETNNPPSERYIEIMIAGCQHYGVDPKYVEFLRNVKQTPRPSPESYISFGTPDNQENFMALDEVLANDGSDGKTLYFTINRKVVAAMEDLDSKFFHEMKGMFQKMGQIGDILISRIAFDPKFGIPERHTDFTPEHSAYCENAFCEYMKMKGVLQHFKPIAWLRV